MNKTDMAKVAHEAMRAYKIQLGEEDIGVWDKSSKYMKDSILSGVEYVMNNPNTTAEHQHEAWCKHKKDTGWLFGKEKDEKLRTHPLLIPYNKVPADNKIKAELFIGVVKALLPTQNFIGG